MVKNLFIVVLSLILMLSLISCQEKKPTLHNDLDDALAETKLDESEESISVNEGTENTDNTAEVKDPMPEDSETLKETTDPENILGTDEALPLSGVKICIDAGHGRFSESRTEPIGPGASTMKAAFVTGTEGNYQSEAEFNLKIAKLLESLLTEQGAVIYMTRTDEYATLSNVGRAQLGNDNNCDIAVRIHADGSTNSQAHGISMLVPARNEFITDDYILTESTEAGRMVLDSVIEKTGALDLGIRPRNDMTGFNWSTIPSILIECGFMTNPAEDAKLADPEYQQLIAEGICQGLITYFN